MVTSYQVTLQRDCLSFPLKYVHSWQIHGWFWFEEFGCKIQTLPSRIPYSLHHPIRKSCPEHELQWSTWKSLNRIRTQVGTSVDVETTWRMLHQHALCLRIPVTKHVSSAVMSTVADQLHAEDPLKATNRYI